jgi:ATP-dependent Clp protease ATP-binding subunit ClpA
MFEHFTERARQIVVGAQEEARTFGHGHIGTEHVLVALAADPEHDWSARFLAGMGIDAPSAREWTLRAIGPGSQETLSQIPFTRRAKRLLELSVREARSLWNTAVEPEHLLLALARDPETTGAQILHDAGVLHEQIRRDVADRIASHPELFPQGEWESDPPAPRPRRAESPGHFQATPDLALSRWLMSAAARGLSHGRTQYGIEDLMAVLEQQPADPTPPDPDERPPHSGS